MLIPHLIAIQDEQPHSAAVDMAIDEMLLQNLEQPTLRLYRWAEPTVSFGYFTPITEVEGRSGRGMNSSAAGRVGGLCRTERISPTRCSVPSARR